MAWAFRATFCRTSSTWVGRPLVVPDRAGGGLGLGLTIVRRLIELPEGRVEANSRGAGMGSEFMVRLPMMDAVPDILPARNGPSPQWPA